MRRVVITGMGIVSPLGKGLKVNWQRLTHSQSGIRAITRFEAGDLACRIAGLIPSEGEGAFNPDDHVPPKDQKKMDDFIIYGIAAADEAIADSGWKPATDEEGGSHGGMGGGGARGALRTYNTAT